MNGAREFQQRPVAAHPGDWSGMRSRKDLREVALSLDLERADAASHQGMQHVLKATYTVICISTHLDSTSGGKISRKKHSRAWQMRQPALRRCTSSMCVCTSTTLATLSFASLQAASGPRSMLGAGGHFLCSTQLCSTRLPRTRFSSGWRD